MSDILIRPFEEWSSAHDFQELVTVFCRSFQRTDSDAVETMITKELKEGHHYLIVEDDGQIVGFASFRMWGEPRHRFFELYHIGVDPGSLGRGVGRDLVSAIENAAHEHIRQFGYPGARKIFLLTHEGNTPAHRLYEKCGFRKVATLPEFFREGVDEAVFEKEFHH